MFTTTHCCHSTKQRHAISENSYEQALATVASLSPMQLHCLQEQIQDSLKPSDSQLLTNEELDMIISLFTDAD